MRAPIDLPGFTLEVVYPSSIYSLERHENIAYERFAHNVFRESVCALTERHIPPHVVVSFVPVRVEYPAWVINCRVKHEAAAGSRFIVECPEMLPCMLLLFAHIVAPHLGNDERFSSPSDQRTEISAFIQHFIDCASAAVRAFKSHGLASAIRTAHDTSSLDMPAMEMCFDDFDALAYLIANHEVAHIYVEQLTTQSRSSQKDRRAFEYLADLVAAEWLFRRYILLTPDQPAYRERRGFACHADALAVNSKWVISSMVTLLVLMGVAGAQRSGGRFNLESGISHPGAFGRSWLQQEWILGAIEAHIAGELGEDRMSAVMSCWTRALDVIIKCGLVSQSAMWQVVDEKEIETIRRAVEIAEERRIEEILLRLDFLKAQLDDAAQMRFRINRKPYDSGV
jgi:hypothetical protein